MTDDEAIRLVLLLRRYLVSGDDVDSAVNRVVELAREALRLRALLTDPSDEMIKAAAAAICGPDPDELAALPEDERIPYMVCAAYALRAAGRAALGEKGR